MRRNGQKRGVVLNRRPFRFSRISWDSMAKGLVLSWATETSVSNFFICRLFVIGFSWPPIRWLDIGYDKESRRCFPVEENVSLRY